MQDCIKRSMLLYGQKVKNEYMANLLTRICAKVLFAVNREDSTSCPTITLLKECLLWTFWELTLFHPFELHWPIILFLKYMYIYGDLNKIKINTGFRICKVFYQILIYHFWKSTEPDPETVFINIIFSNNLPKNRYLFSDMFPWNTIICPWTVQRKSLWHWKSLSFASSNHYTSFIPLIFLFFSH